MFHRRHITLCRESWYLICVLGFVICGAVFREVNLLVLVAGLMVGPVVFSWRMVSATLRGLEVRRRLPVRIGAGDPLVVELEVVNTRRRLGSWALVVADTITWETSSGRDETTTVETFVPFVAAGKSAVVSYRSLLTRRGLYQFGPVWITSRFPMGFVRGRVKIPSETSLIVCPRLGRLTRQWSETMESDRAGNLRSQRRHGLAEGDYYGLREWRPGDSRRWIHWRTSAKVGGLAVLQFEQQRNRDIALVLDLWQPDHPTEADLERVELAVSFAATAIVDFCQRGNSQLLVGLCSRAQSVWSAPASKLFSQELLDMLAVVEGSSNTLPAPMLTDIRPQLQPGTRVVVISTRGTAADGTAEQPDARPITPRAGDGGAALWINVSDPQLNNYFQMD